METKNKMKTPLTLITVGIGVGFFDGMFGWGLSDDLYTFTGLIALVGIVWSWVVLLKKEN